jgi:hypothetical protein
MRGVVSTVVVLAFALWANSAGAVETTSALASINALRTAHGLPGGIREDPQWSEACAAHDAYAIANGGFDAQGPHGELVGRPGYSTLGARGGQSSILSSGGWSEPNPWINAPYHLAQLLAPGISTLGFADRQGYVCAATVPAIAHGRAPVSDEEIFTFPGAGARGVPSRQAAMESDAGGNLHVPGDLVGLPHGTTTGPYLYVFSGGPGFDDGVRGATLVGPSGPVDVRVVREFFNLSTPAGASAEVTKDQKWHASYLIPAAPLLPNAAYTAVATIRVTKAQLCTRSGVPSALAESLAVRPPLCPAGVAAFCTVGAYVTLYPEVPACPDGERVRSSPVAQVPPLVFDHEWRFTTGTGALGIPTSAVGAGGREPISSHSSPAARSMRFRSRVVVRRRVARHHRISVRVYSTRPVVAHVVAKSRRLGTLFDAPRLISPPSTEIHLRVSRRASAPGRRVRVAVHLSWPAASGQRHRTVRRRVVFL